jgi:alkylation response protein AidB-like acyl-CoA dehydrogenase
MEFALTEDQRLIQDSARTLLSETARLDRLHSVIESAAGWDEALWASLAGDLGFAGLMIPETFGGSGLGGVEMALVLEETGSALAAVPFFETAVIGAQAILLAGSGAQQAALLPGLAAGRSKVAFAFTPVVGSQLRLEHGTLVGVADFVTFAHVADLLIVLTEDQRLLALPAATPGIDIQKQPNLDLTRPFARVAFNAVTVPDAAVLGNSSSARPAVERLFAVAAGLLAAEQTGGAAFCLSSTVAYAKQRVQFGRVIGSFQAVKHELADMMVLVEAARSAALYAAAAIDEGGPELFEAASVARAWCSDAYQHCAAEAIQLHGGIGFTWEHHAHLYFKRARSSSMWFGDATLHREKIARIIGLAPAETA